LRQLLQVDSGLNSTTSPYLVDQLNEMKEKKMLRNFTGSLILNRTNEDISKVAQ